METQARCESRRRLYHSATALRLMAGLAAGALPRRNFIVLDNFLPGLIGGVDHFDQVDVFRADQTFVPKKLEVKRLTPELMKELASHKDLRLRELVAHQAWNPHISLRDQHTVASTLEPADVRARAVIWINRRTNSSGTLTADDLDSYWESRDL